MANDTNSTDVEGSGSAESLRRVSDAAGTATDRAKEVLQEKVQAGAETTASSMRAAADTLRRAAEDVSGDHAWIGSALRKSADGLENATASIAGGNLEQGLNELAAFARRQPAMFLGASFALGFALARVGKTAIEQATDGVPKDAERPHGGYDAV